MHKNQFYIIILIIIIMHGCSGDNKREIKEQAIRDSLQKEEQVAKQLRAKELIKALDIQMIPVQGRNYSIGKYEVQQKLWIQIMGNNPSHYKCNECPVTNVTWNEVIKFIRLLNNRTMSSFRLPTEDEWNFAFRGGNQDRGYRYSGSNTFEDVAYHIYDYYGENSDTLVYPSGLKKPNQLGIYDMTGNVAEWCDDWDRAWDRILRDNNDYTEGNRMKIVKNTAYMKSHEEVDASEDWLGFRLAL